MLERPPFRSETIVAAGRYYDLEVRPTAIDLPIRKLQSDRLPVERLLAIICPTLALQSEGQYIRRMLPR